MNLKINARAQNRQHRIIFANPEIYSKKWIIYSQIVNFPFFIKIDFQKRSFKIDLNQHYFCQIRYNLLRTDLHERKKSGSLDSAVIERCCPKTRINITYASYRNMSSSHVTHHNKVVFIVALLIPQDKYNIFHRH